MICQNRQLAAERDQKAVPPQAVRFELRSDIDLGISVLLKMLHDHFWSPKCVYIPGLLSLKGGRRFSYSFSSNLSSPPQGSCPLTWVAAVERHCSWVVCYPSVQLDKERKRTGKTQSSPHVSEWFRCRALRLRYQELLWSLAVLNAATKAARPAALR